MQKAQFLLLILCLAGCAWEPEPQLHDTTSSVPARTASSAPAPEASVPTRAQSRGDVGWIAASIAQSQIGVPYLYGGSTPQGFDCSGLVYYSYSGAGKVVPRTTSALWRAAATVAEGSERPGDLVFFDTEGKPGHVGIYLGDGFFVHAPSSGKNVVTARLDDGWYAQQLLRIGRLPD